ncbi:MAG: hypothetical protein DME58_10410 [Verrucomicrobia bacterium]|nr:MAG: hypothetical protein DME58_10410 [Verrucomicrobiota bacterium]
MRFIFVLGLAGPEDSTVPNESHAIAGMFAAIFEYELGDVGFARSPRFSAIMRSYCPLWCARAADRCRDCAPAQPQIVGDLIATHSAPIALR